MMLHVDTIQKFTYALCHIYTRCARSIAIPVPVAYADLAAYRGRNWVVGKQVTTAGRLTDDDIQDLNKEFKNIVVAKSILFYS